MTKHIEELKELNTLLQSDTIEAEGNGDPDHALKREIALNRALDLATNLSYTYPKDAYEMWLKHMPESEPVPSILKDAYDRLSPEEKAETISALDKAAFEEARSDNQHKIIAKVLDRLDAKYPGASSLSDIDAELSQAAFYKEIVNVFEEKDFPAAEQPEMLPSLEDMLRLTNFLERHNDTEQRAELDRLAAEYAAKVMPEVTHEQLDFGNALEVEDANKVVFQSFAELEEYTQTIAKDGITVALANYDAVVYVDKQTDRLTLAAKSPRDLYDIEALTLGGDGKEADLQSSSGNKMVFNAKGELGAVPAMSIALVRLKLNEKEIHDIQTAVREIMKPRPIDISEQVVKRALELRMQRKQAQERAERERIARELEAQEHNASEAVAPDGGVQGQGITREDAFSFAGSGKVVPPQIERSYVKISDKRGDKYYLSSRMDTVAFVDKGSKLETKSDSEHTAEALVLIADARGWDNLKVSGTEKFRREVWLEASARGIVVRGYTPTDIDKALLAKRAERVEKIEHNAIEPISANEKTTLKAVDTGRKPADEKAVVKAIDAGKKDQAKGTGRDDASKVLSGTLIEHGAAPFDFDESNNPNYFVKYKDDEGQERITWGLDLERAIAKSQAKPGDKITLHNEGRKPVEVDAPVKDEAGKVVGTKKIKTHRNAWTVEVAKDFLNMRAQDFAAKHPEHLHAAALNEFAKKVADKAPQFAHLSEEDKARFKSSVQDKIAKHIESDRKIAPLKLITRAPEKTAEQERTVEQGRSR